MKATDQLLKDHKMVRKALEGFSPESPDFDHRLKTLQRIVIGHAWFEDMVFLPALEAEPLLDRRFVREIGDEHKDLNQLMKLLRKTPRHQKKELEATFLQFRAILDTHFKKEEDALFPIAERILDNEGLNNLGAEMERRKLEIRGVVGSL